MQEYSTALSQKHLKMLEEGSGIAPEVIAERGYRTCTGYSELKSLGITVRRDTDTHGLLLPLYTVAGKPGETYIAKEDRVVPLMVYRPDTPQIDQEGQPQKYLYPGTQRSRLDCHPRAFPRLGDPTVPLWITEGTKKADSLITQGLCALALLGVWNWRGTTAAGGKMALPDWHEVALNERDVRIVYDSDIVEKASVAHALVALSGMLTAKGAHVHVAYLPSADGAKVGVDDYLLTHTIEELERLLEAPRRSKPKAAQSLSTLKLTRTQEPRPILFNLMEVLTHDPHWQGVLHYNDFTGSVELHAPPPCFALDMSWKVCPLEGHHTSEIARWFQDVYDICAPTALVFEALVTIAHRATYNPVRDYLTSLTWDGIARLDTWLTDYCHVEDSLYTRAVGAKTLIAGAARIMQPGCKVDTMTILVGEQGYLKSWVWRVLASEPWFTDHLSDLHSKDALMDLRGKWIVEFADLDNFARSEVETIKRFLSATQDHYRAPYERHASTIPRAVIFAGTTNRETFFKDETGNRRFWPVKVQGRCDIAGLAGVRDQLWAEALHHFRAGDIWYLTGEVLEQAEEEQAARVEVDPWTTPICNYLKSNLLRKAKYKDRTVQMITTNELLEYALGLETLHWTSGNSRRVSAILRLQGWHYDRVENPLKDEGNQPRQIKAFIYETDETDTSPREKLSVSTSSPLKTSRETDETDETDHLYMCESTKKREERKQESLYKSEPPSVSTVSSVSNGTIPSISTDCNETDTRIGSDFIGLRGTPHRSQAPTPPCFSCRGTNYWTNDAGMAICARCHPQPQKRNQGMVTDQKESRTKRLCFVCWSPVPEGQPANPIGLIDDVAAGGAANASPMTRS